MSTSRPVWRISLAVCVTTLACNSEVTVEPTGTGGGTSSTSSSAAGGTTSVGGSGGAIGGGGAGATGGTGGVGGEPAGGSGGEGGSGGGGGGEICPGFSPCTDCMSTGCSEVYCACANEDHCLGYLDCLSYCAEGDNECRQMCANNHEPGIAAAILVVDCAATVCDGTCMFGKELNDCQTCLYTSCPEQMNACIADAECIALVQCLQTCSGDMACAQACIGDHPDGLPEAQAVKMCQTDNCFDPCL